MPRQRPLRQMLERVTGRKVSLLYGQANPDVTDDTRNVTVALTPYPLMVIVDVTAPSSARPGETFGVSYSFRNIGGDGVMWTRLWDLDTGEEYVSRMEFPIEAGVEGKSATIPITMPDRDLHMEIQIGHVE